MSFQSHRDIAELDLWMIFGDHFSKTFTFPFNLTGYDFLFLAAENVGSSPVIQLEGVDMTIVAGDPTSVTNSVTVEIPYTDTELFDFECLFYVFKWINGSGEPRTFVKGSLHGEGSIPAGS